MTTTETEGLNEFQAKWGAVVRLPTAEEARRVGRDFPMGDAVLRLEGTAAALQIVADAMGASGYCDGAHVLPGVGVYLEE
jgi:hypothetical protein